jgi:hypothetical protein
MAVPYKLDALYFSGIFLVFVSVRGSVNPRVIVWIRQIENIMISSEIEPATF